ncbi:MAG TPA: iron-sulfur cluster repair di-iron protein [Candidatus Kapabacteria bacterium]|nr:iron-sulfur cluster repair di-iron protein [Candidatus Kapabacteria bacterium]
MSHKPNVFSPPGTPLLDRTVGELVAERPGRSRVFQNFGIDFCCQGARTLRQACEGKNVSSDSVVEQLEAELQDKAAPKENPAELPIPELVDFIVKTHHGFLWRELPRLHAMSARVAQVHGGHTPSLVEVFEVFTGLEGEMVSHMKKEEEILFPTVVAMSRNEVPPVPLDDPISCMMHEHESSGQALERLRELTHGFRPPPEACNTYRALFAGLHDLEEDLHRHIHLENAVLFPTAQALTVGKR